MDILRHYPVLVRLTAASVRVLGLTVLSSSNANTAELVPNPSIESGTTTPTSWNTNTSGVNTSSFTWSTDGHTGSRSLRRNVTAFTSGDAKWWFNPVAVSPNTTYTYSYWSRSTVDSQLLVEFGNGTGNVSVVWLATMPASPGGVDAAHQDVHDVGRHPDGHHVSRVGDSRCLRDR